MYPMWEDKMKSIWVLGEIGNSSPFRVDLNGMHIQIKFDFPPIHFKEFVILSVTQTEDDTDKPALGGWDEW